MRRTPLTRLKPDSLGRLEIRFLTEQEHAGHRPVQDVMKIFPRGPRPFCVMITTIPEPGRSDNIRVVFRAMPSGSDWGE